MLCRKAKNSLLTMLRGYQGKFAVLVPYTLQQHFRLWVKFVKTPFAHESLGLVAKTKALCFDQTARQMLNTFYSAYRCNRTFISIFAATYM